MCQLMGNYNSGNSTHKCLRLTNMNTPSEPELTGSSQIFPAALILNWCILLGLIKTFHNLFNIML